MEDINIREANLDDVIGIVYVQATTWIDNYSSPENGISEEDIRSLDFNSKIRDWQHMIQSPSYQVWVAAIEGEIVGFSSARKDGDSYEIYEQCVLPAYQEEPLGGQLLEQALRWIGEDKAVTVRVISYDQKGVAFYKTFGFKVSELGEVDFIRLPSGKSIPTIELLRSQGGATTAQLPETVLAEPLPEPDPPTPAVRPTGRKAKLVGRAKLAKLSKLRDSTIKFYTEIGLLPYKQEAKRLARRYNVQQSLARLKEIQQLRKQGLSIKDITNRLK